MTTKKQSNNKLDLKQLKKLARKVLKNEREMEKEIIHNKCHCQQNH